jgi:hypothetical protein
MGEVLDLQAGRSRHGHKHKERRAAELKEALRAAREGAAPDPASAAARQQATNKLLALFKGKTSGKGKPSGPGSKGPRKR